MFLARKPSHLAAFLGLLTASLHAIACGADDAVPAAPSNANGGSAGKTGSAGANGLGGTAGGSGKGGARAGGAAGFGGRAGGNAGSSAAGASGANGGGAGGATQAGAAGATGGGAAGAPAAGSGGAKAGSGGMSAAGSGGANAGSGGMSAAGSGGANAGTGGAGAAGLGGANAGTGGAGAAGAGGANAGSGGASAAGSAGTTAGSGGSAVCAGNGSPAGDYIADIRTVQSSGNQRTYVLSRPVPTPANLPLVFSLHGDGGNGESMRAALPLEAEAKGAAIFVYPNAPDGTFEYYTYDGRTKEAQFVQDVIAQVAADLCIEPSRVFLTGMSGGATMANALGCRLGSGVVRGLGIHSGSLYPTKNGGVDEFTYTGNGGVSCDLPATLFVWGKNDATDGVSFTTGESVRDNYVATQGCENKTSPWSTSPCVQYAGCSKDVVWCPIDGLGHAIWPGAAGAIWSFFDGEK